MTTARLFFWRQAQETLPSRVVLVKRSARDGLGPSASVSSSQLSFPKAKLFHSFDDAGESLASVSVELNARQTTLSWLLFELLWCGARPG